MEKYQNRDGVIVSAERVVDGEHAGLWRTVDTNGVEGHVTDEQFQRNFKPAESAPKPSSSSDNKG